MKLNSLFSLLLVCSSVFCLAQNETSQWHFGSYAGLDFTSGTPLSVQSPTMLAPENASSIADASGNLLFYTNSENIWDRSHNIMANGSGILGDWSSMQSVIVKRPGSGSIYYVFTLDDMGGPNGLCYTTVDMSLAAGMGSVTVKNTNLASACSEQITATRHCNGTDIWIMTHSFSGNTFKAFLVTSAGVNSTPITSNIGTSYMQLVASGVCMKFSPNSRKLGVPIVMVSQQQNMSSAIELFDFDNSTGQLSSAQNIPVANTTTLSNNGCYGSEFSPDGTKFYITQMISAALIQCDLCNSNAITTIPSQFSGLGNYLAALQLGPDGKIYVARASNSSMGVINNPNASGAACNYNDMGPALVPYGQMQPGNQLGLPGFVCSSFLKLPAPSVTYVESCQNATFTPSPAICFGSGMPVLNRSWNFGDPASGSANISGSTIPAHYFQNPGTYTVQLITNYPCYSDTAKVQVTIGSSGPNLQLNGPATICRGNSATYSVTGSSSYTWSSGTTGTVVTLAPASNTSYTVTGTNPATGCTASRVFSISVAPCTGIELLNAAGNNRLLVYPNPAQQKITVETDNAGLLRIYDQLGALVMEQQVAGGKTVLDMGRLSDGLYILKHSHAQGESITRLVKTE